MHNPIHALGWFLLGIIALFLWNFFLMGLADKRTISYGQGMTLGIWIPAVLMAIVLICW